VQFKPKEVSSEIFVFLLYVDSLKKIQLKIATVEHLTLLSETICSKYHQLKQTYESTSKKSTQSHKSQDNTKLNPLTSKSALFSSSSSSSASNATNRTCAHFNKLIIDERRKLETLEKKIKDSIKSLGFLEGHEKYSVETAEDTRGHDRRDGDGTNEAKPATPSRRASVSLRQALASTSAASSSGIQQRKPFQSVAEDDEEGSGMSSKKPFQSQTKPQASSRLGSPGRSTPQTSSPSLTRPYLDDEGENTIGLSKQEIERRQLFRKSEADRLQLIEENQRLRNEINQESAKVYNRNPEHNGGDSNLSYVISELNRWDVERDELDAHIDRLNAQKEELLQKLALTSRGARLKKYLDE
jgi:hypothetical protein